MFRKQVDFVKEKHRFARAWNAHGTPMERPRSRFLERHQILRSWNAHGTPTARPTFPIFMFACRLLAGSVAWNPPRNAHGTPTGWLEAPSPPLGLWGGGRGRRSFNDVFLLHWACLGCPIFKFRCVCAMPFAARLWTATPATEESKKT